MKTGDLFLSTNLDFALRYRVQNYKKTLPIPYKIRIKVKRNHILNSGCHRPDRNYRNYLKLSSGRLDYDKSVTTKLPVEMTPAIRTHKLC